MGLFNIFNRAADDKGGPARRPSLSPRLEGWAEGHTTIAWDATLEREAPVDTRKFLVDEAEESLKNSRLELHDWIRLEQEGFGPAHLTSGCNLLPDYWATAYSAGYPLADLAKLIDEYLDQCEAMDRVFRKRYPALAHNAIEDVGGGYYWRKLDHLGWLVGLRATREQISRYLAFTGAPGQDALFDRIVLTLGFDRPVADALILERAYKDTLALFEDPEVKRSARLVRVLKTWVRTRLTDVQPDKPGGPRYRGMWATDVALLVMTLKLDDSAFRDAQHYPADLVDYYRANPAG